MPLSHTKRFLERFIVQPAFRAACAENPADAAAAVGLEIDPAALPELLSPEFVKATRRAPEVDTWFARAHPVVKEYGEFMRWKFQFRDAARRDGAPSQPHFRRWRDRHIQRSTWELGTERAKALVHPPMCIELTDGCSVGCWFCGVGATRIQGVFERSLENTHLWQGVLEALREELGPGVGQGFCYWATDPLDNPDYEEFLLDYRRILGRLPQTTTAQPLKDLARTRRLLDLSREHGGQIERFSVLSGRTFEGILEAFTPDELLLVELIPQFDNRASPKALAGAGRERALRRAEKGLPVEGDIEDGGTIACVTGFLLNMVRREVKLISPCRPTPRWPLGYVVFEHFHFSDAATLRQELRRICETAMPMTVERDHRMRLNPRMNLAHWEDGFSLTTRHVSLDFRRFREGAELGEQLGSGQMTAGQIAATRLQRHGIAAEETFRDLTRVFECGVIDEEPLAESAGVATDGGPADVGAIGLSEPWLDRRGPIIGETVPGRRGPQADVKALAKRLRGYDGAAEILAKAAGLRWNPVQRREMLGEGSALPTDPQAEAVVIADTVNRAGIDEAFRRRFEADSMAILRAAGVVLVGIKTVRVHVNRPDRLYVPVGYSEGVEPPLPLPDMPTREQVTAWIQAQVRAGGPLAEDLLRDATAVLARHGVRLPVG